MGVIENHLSKVQRSLSENNLEKILFSFLKSIQSELASKNVEQLNKQHVDIYGDAIGFYSKTTEILSFGKKKAGQPYDMKDTGEFLSKFYANVSNNIITFGSTDPKTDDILDNPNLLSVDLFGLTDENLNEVINSNILPFMLQYSAKELTNNK